MIIFDNHKESEEYEKYKPIRGVGTYQLVEKALTMFSGSDDVSYSKFSGFIRYDKRLRDFIYIYLGTLEEYLKNLIFSKIEYIGNSLIKSINKSNIYLFRLSDNYGFNFYKHSSFNFSSLEYIIRHFINEFNFEIANEVFLDKISEVRLLRNDIMHHSFLLVTPLVVDDKTLCTDRMKTINNWVKSLHDLLPKEWKNGYKRDFDKLKYDRNVNLLTEYYLEVIYE